MAQALSLKAAFGTDNPSEIADRLEVYKSALNEAPTTADGTFTPALPSFEAQPDTPAQTFSKGVGAVEALGSLLKGASPDIAATIASLQTQLATAQDGIVKDLTLTNPLATGYVAYDLEIPAKMLTPKPTPLRNMLPRTKGIGTARRYKRITGFTGTGTAGVGLVRPGITDSTTTAFGGISFQRGPKISYAGDESSVPYLQFSLSDSVPWSAQFAGQGFQDIRQLSQTTLLYGSMLMEERLLLGGRGTAAGFQGALTTPGTPTLTVRNAAGSEVGSNGAIGTLYVSVTAASVFGETVLAQASTAGVSASGKVVDVQLPATVTGAIGYKVYAGTAAAVASQFPATLTVSSGSGVQATVYGNQVGSLAVASGTAGAVTINLNGTGTGGCPATGNNPPASATDSAATDYDGILTIAAGSNSGYVRSLNSTFSANPGDDYNQAFVALWESVKADPDLVLLAGSDRKQLSDLIKINSNSSAYRVSLTRDEAHNATIGAMVTGLQNEVTGKMVDLVVHPWLPQGVSPILSLELPIPDTEVSSCFQVVNVQDFMSVDWPVLGFSYDVSSYWFGTFICYAPAWQACLTGIVRK